MQMKNILLHLDNAFKRKWLEVECLFDGLNGGLAACVERIFDKPRANLAKCSSLVTFQYMPFFQFKYSSFELTDRICPFRCKSCGASGTTSWPAAWSFSLAVASAL